MLADEILTPGKRQTASRRRAHGCVDPFPTTAAGQSRARGAGAAERLNPGVGHFQIPLVQPESAAANPCHPRAFPYRDGNRVYDSTCASNGAFHGRSIRATNPPSATALIGSAAARSETSQWRGIRTVKLAPLPIPSLRAVILPPWASTRVCTI